MTTPAKRKQTKANGIHSGETTHHQDHPITSVSFNTRKTTNRINGREDKSMLIRLLLFDIYH